MPVSISLAAKADRDRLACIRAKLRFHVLSGDDFCRAPIEHLAALDLAALRELAPQEVADALEMRALSLGPRDMLELEEQARALNAPRLLGAVLALGFLLSDRWAAETAKAERDRE